jgi:hypothetical protein
VSILGKQAMAPFASRVQVPVKRRIKMRMESDAKVNFFISFSLIRSDNRMVILADTQLQCPEIISELFIYS